MRVDGNVFYDSGPALLFDEAHRPRWRSQVFDRFVAEEGWRHDAEKGFCAFLRQDGMRQIDGKFELFIDEAPPSHVKYAHAHVDGLWLEVPSGRLVIDSAASLVADRSSDSMKESAICTVDVAPGAYLIEIYGYDDHEARLENEDAPAEPPHGAWWTALNLVDLALGVLSLIALFLLYGFVKESAFVDAAWIIAGAVVLIGVRTGLWHFSGESARERERQQKLKATLAALPPVPSFTIVLRKADREAPCTGGGLVA